MAALSASLAQALAVCAVGLAFFAALLVGATAATVDRSSGVLRGRAVITRRLLVAVTLAASLSVALGAVLSVVGKETASRQVGSCRDWVADPAYRAEIASVGGLVPKLKRAFAAPGLSVAIAADGKLVWSRSCGFADVARHRAVMRTTQFRIGSVSKPLTAALAARLVQRGRFHVDADVRDFVAAFPPRHPRLTLRQLGGHLGGIRHYQGSEALNTSHYGSVAASLQIFMKDPLVALPGDEFRYSSYGFNLLGTAIAAANESSFAAALREHLLEPLGMSATSAGNAPRGGTRFYEVTDTRRAVPAPHVDLSDRYPSGGLLSTAEDLVRFGIGVTDPGFLGAAMQELLFTTQRTRDGEPTGYGFGFEVGKSPVGAVAGHTGNVIGGTAFLLIHPRTRVVVAMTTNVGFVTVRSPPDLVGVPDPPQLAMPFIRRVLAGR